MMRNIALVLILVLFIGCGSKGDLALEPESLPLKITDLKVSQIGSDLVLNFTFPGLLSDKKELAKSRISQVLVYHSNTTIPEERFRKKGSVLLKIKKPGISILTTAVPTIIKIPIKVKDIDKKEHFLGIIYYVDKKRSPMSAISSIATVIPYKSIEKIKIEQERKIILIKWEKPEYDISKNKISQIAGFSIYRKLERLDDEVKDDKISESEEPVFNMINSGFVTDEYFEDTDVSLDGKYSYYVSTLYNKKIESSPSKIVSIVLSDIYPPDVPENLFVFKGDSFMFLNWDEVKDLDLSHYIIFRKSTKTGKYTKIADNIEKTRFKDNNVKKGILYFYYVVAVDKKGNESESSIIVKERY